MKDKEQSVFVFVPIQSHGVSNARGVIHAVLTMNLPRAIGVKLPDAGLQIQLRAWRQAGAAFGAGFFHTGVGWRADVHINMAHPIKGEGLGGVLALLQKARNHHLRLGCWHHFIAFKREANHLGVGAVIKMPIMKIDAGSHHVTEIFDLVGHVVTVIVFERHNAFALMGAAQGHINNAIFTHCHMAGKTQIVGKDCRFKAIRQAKANFLIDGSSVINRIGTCLLCWQARRQNGGKGCRKGKSNVGHRGLLKNSSKG